MANVNKVILIGNLTRDPEIRQTPKGVAVGDIAIAVNRAWNDNGVKKEETTFVDVTVWGRTAENLGRYCRKGNPVYVEGHLHMDSWEDKDGGGKRYKMKVVADSVQYLGGKKDNGSGDAGNGDGRYGNPAQNVGVMGPDGVIRDGQDGGW